MTTDELKQKLAAHITKLREARGLSQEAVAEASGLTQAAISRMETGRVWPRLLSLVKLARVYKVYLHDMVKIQLTPEVGSNTLAKEEAE